MIITDADRLDWAARIIGRLTEQRDMLAHALDSLLEDSHRRAPHEPDCKTCRAASIVYGEFERLKKKYG